MKFASLSRFCFASLTAAAASIDVANAESFHSDVVASGSSSSGGLRHQHRALRNDEIPLNLGGIGKCSRDEPCERCEGDCHRDSDCAGDLVCYNVSGKHKPGDFCAKIPGCSGEDLSKTDWCIRPEDMPVPNLCDTREEANSHQNNNNNNNNEAEQEAVEEPPVEVIIETSSCDELEALVFDLTTKINDVDAETVRYQILTDELAQTAMIASPDVAEGRLRRFLEDETVRTEVEGGLEKLTAQKQRLSDGNGRVTELNSVLREYVGFWKDENGALHGRVNDLSIENQSLQAERDDLSVQIDELGLNINNLQDLIDTHGDLNDQLDDSVSDLQAEIDRLKAENEEYQRLNTELSGLIGGLETEVGNLEEQNNIFEQLNGQLAATSERLGEQVSELTEQNDELSMHVTELETAVTQLANETDRLTGVNEELGSNIETLQEEVDALQDSVEQLQQLNDQLDTIVSFVNETGIGIDETYDEVREFLAEQIVGYRSVALESLQNIYTQRILLWDCAYRETFSDYDFSFDDSLEIPEQDVEGGVFDMVIDYVEDRVLNELCLSVVDFEAYLEDIFNEPVYTSNHLISGMNSYTTLALDYYFPDHDESGNGLTLDDWAMAGYKCGKLPEDMIFQYGQQ